MESQQDFISFSSKTKLLINRFNDKKNKIIGLIKSSKGLAKTSKHNINKLVEEIDSIFNEQNKLLIEENKSKQEIIKLQTDIPTQQKSYAQVIKDNNHNTINKTTSHVITVFPKSQDITSENIKKKIKPEINPIALKVGINKIKNISKNGIIIECKTTNECEILKNEINSKLNTGCEAKQPIKKKPKLIIYNVSNDIDKETLISLNKTSQ